MLVTVSALLVPELTCSVTVDWEVAPTVTLPNVSVDGERLAPGAEPVPVSAMT